MSTNIENYVNLHWKNEQGQKCSKVVKILEDSESMVQALGQLKCSDKIEPIPTNAIITNLTLLQKKHFCMENPSTNPNDK